jgi:ABC-type polysaccharide/polyol phosphate export permease
MMAAILSEASSLYHGEGSKFGQVQLEYSLLAYALLLRNLIAFAHNLSLYVVVCLIFAPHFLQPFALLAIPGLLLLMINAAWVVLLLGMFALRFRDVAQFVGSVVNIAMFITPVFWLPDALSGMKQFIFVTLNPLFHLIDVVRAPMLDRWPANESYIFVGLLALFGWTLTYLVFSKFRKRIAYWS